ncbi:unnamed protein product, partial [Brugia timori]|uniref:LigA n=1 Tax=Brugia timori TaxID=42155 RepID=A0A0R3QI50_9BILA
MSPCSTSCAAENSVSPQKPEAQPMRRVSLLMPIGPFASGCWRACAAVSAAGAVRLRPHDAPDALGGGADATLAVAQLAFGKGHAAPRAHHPAMGFEARAGGGIDVGDVEVDGRLAQFVWRDAAHLGPCQVGRGDGAAERGVEHVGDDAAVDHVGRAAAAALHHGGLAQVHDGTPHAGEFQLQALRAEEGVAAPALPEGRVTWTSRARESERLDALDMRDQRALGHRPELPGRVGIGDRNPVFRVTVGTLAHRGEHLRLARQPVRLQPRDGLRRRADDVAVRRQDEADVVLRAFAQQPVERVDVGGHVAVGRVDHRRAAVEHVVAGEQQPILLEHQAHV